MIASDSIAWCRESPRFIPLVLCEVELDPLAVMRPPLEGPDVMIVPLLMLCMGTGERDRLLRDDGPA